MGFWKELSKSILDESILNYAKDKTLGELCDSINTNSLTSDYSRIVLKERLKRMGNRELMLNYREYCGCSTDELIEIFEKEIYWRGMNI